MSIPEILHRVSEQWKRSVSQFYIPNIIKEFKSNKPLPKLPGITEKLSNIRNDEQTLNQWIDFANSIVSKQYKFLGIQWPQETLDKIWHYDPISYKDWPSSKYCFQINYRNTDDYGDVKYVWELNKLQFLQPIAALAYIKNDEQLSLYCIKVIESWVDNNPTYKGINWSSGIELAFRIISIIIVTSLIDDSFFTKKQVYKFHNTLAYHGYWLMRYPSKFSSANNHLIAEAAALYLLGTLAPNLPNANKWKDYGKNILIKQAPKQIYDDGVGAEQSISYTALTLEWFLLCGTVGKYVNDEFPNNFWIQIKKAGEFIRIITDKNGNQPHIGDNDESQVIYSKLSSIPYTTSILSCIPCDVNNSPNPYSKIHSDHLCYSIIGKANLDLSPFCESKCFQQGGYTVSRSCANNKEFLLVFDHGPLGYLDIAAHGHADVLAIWLHIDGFPVIVDAGTYKYHSDSNWRNYMRSTPAHNTLSIGGENSSKISSAFNWSTKAKSTLIDYKVSNNNVLVRAEHDGYKKRFGVKHRRQIQKYNDNSFKLTDSLHGKNIELPVEIGFLFHPKLSLYKTNNIWTVYHNQNPILEIENENNLLNSSVKLGQKNPMRGWYSEKFGHVTPAPRLQFEGKLKTNHAFNIHFRLI